MRRVYFDHNATTPVAAEALAAMLPYFSTEYGNASSIHSFGQRARGAVERARAAMAALLGARPNEIIFTSGGTESDNAAIFGSCGAVASAYVASTARAGGPVVSAESSGFASGVAGGVATGHGHVITTTIEHHAVLHACQALERRGIPVTYVPVHRDGIVNPGDVRRALRPETHLITVMHANNELGTIQPIAEIGRIAAEAGVRFHTDAVQSAGKITMDVNELGVHLLSVSGHKFGAPKGVGALFVRGKTPLEPILYGGHNDRDRRAGTDNVPGIVALGKAAEIALAGLVEGGSATRVLTLRDRLEQGLLARIPGASVNGALAERTPNTSNMLFPMVDSEALVIALDLAGLACSAGAACSSGAVNPSHVLTAIGLSPEEARSSVRLSLGSSNIEEDVALALELIPHAVARQREVSADWIAARRRTVSVAGVIDQRPASIHAVAPATEIVAISACATGGIESC